MRGVRFVERSSCARLGRSNERRVCALAQHAQLPPRTSSGRERRARYGFAFLRTPQRRAPADARGLEQIQTRRGLARQTRLEAERGSADVTADPRALA
jgi:hypothetical protein